jgi:hypothetical protein
MIVQGSMNYTTSGRKMGSKSRRKRRQIYHWKTRTEATPIAPVNWRQPTEEYPSVELGSPNTEETAAKEHYVSSNHTIAPAYNKGAYQVISKDDIKHIGK